MPRGRRAPCRRRAPARRTSQQGGGESDGTDDQAQAHPRRLPPGHALPDRARRRQGPGVLCRRVRGAERMRFPAPGGTVAHAEIQIGDSVVIIEDEVPERGTQAPPPGGVAGSPSSLFIYVEDVDAVVARAVELGATLQRSPQDQFYGDRDGHTVDPSGMDGPSRRTWRTWRRRSWCGGWPSCRPRPSPGLAWSRGRKRPWPIRTRTSSGRHTTPSAVEIGTPSRSCLPTTSPSTSPEGTSSPATT